MFIRLKQSSSSIIIKHSIHQRKPYNIPFHTLSKELYLSTILFYRKAHNLHCQRNHFLSNTQSNSPYAYTCTETVALLVRFNKHSLSCRKNEIPNATSGVTHGAAVTVMLAHVVYIALQRMAVVPALEKMIFGLHYNQITIISWTRICWIVAVKHVVNLKVLVRRQLARNRIVVKR